MKAIWENQIIAESDEIIMIEGNYYFPPHSINKKYLEDSKHHSICPLKGEAHYYDIVVDEKRNKDAAWYYPEPKKGSLEYTGKEFANYVSFWKGVEVTQ